MIGHVFWDLVILRNISRYTVDFIETDPLFCINVFQTPTLVSYLVSPGSKPRCSRVLSLYVVLQWFDGILIPLSKTFLSLTVCAKNEDKISFNMITVVITRKYPGST